jgi:hypothetical protein
MSSTQWALLFSKIVFSRWTGGRGYLGTFVELGRSLILPREALEIERNLGYTGY